MHCAAVSLIKRTARLGDILQFMGHGNSRHDPDWVPPPDAEILAAYFRRMMAKQRWTKAQSALKTIRAMQGGLLGALGGGAAQKAKAFPAKGHIAFESVCMRYRPGLPLALNNATFDVPAGGKIGVAGRTGAGKSTLANVLFRTVELCGGRIVIDGYDISLLGLMTLRRGMGIVPQDPVTRSLSSFPLLLSQVKSEPKVCSHR